ncbi:MAG: hypothetical protein AAFQ27_02975 [Pseudomonadota bacterium]
MSRSLSAPLLRSFPYILPIVAIAIARLLTHTPWATHNSGWAAILFAWVVFDALLLGLIARSADNKPQAFQTMGVIAIASGVVLIGAAAPVREVYFDLPQILIAAGLTVAVFVGWSALRLCLAYRSSGSVRIAVETIIPPVLVGLAIAELRVIYLALFRWNAPLDVPAGARAFSYHTYLNPMIASILVLQVLEMSVVHLLLMVWAPTFAWIMLGLSAWGVIWTIALLKSFRINPVLVDEMSVRVRSGMIHDVIIPKDCIASFQTAFSSEELNDKSVLNLAILSAPNVGLRFVRPVPIPTRFGGTRMLRGVALRLDDSAGFLSELEQGTVAK